MSRVLVVGLGQDLGGDDAAGLLTVRSLRRQGPVGVDVVEQPGDAALLAELMAGRDQVVVVDAVSGRDRPGTVLELALESCGNGSSRSSHGLGLVEAVALAGLLGGRPRVRVFGISGSDFRLGARPSPAVRRAATGLAKRLRRELRCA